MAHFSPPEARYDLPIKRGATLRIPMTWRDAANAVVPLAGRAAWIHIRNRVHDDTILLSLTTANARIVLADTSPNITFYISDEDTSLITTWDKGEYDLLIELANGDRRRLFRGEVSVSPGSTRNVP